MERSLTSGSITGNLLRFAFPMIVGNLLQQMYNVADTLIVGRFLGPDALAAVGSSFTLMTFLTSILLGLCMGSGAVFSIRYGEGAGARLRVSIFHSFVLIGALSLLLNLGAFLGMDGIMWVLRVPAELTGLMREYLWVIFWGITATFLYNYFASLLRAVGNSVAPLVFLGVSALLNIGLDLLFVLVFGWGVAGAAGATVLSQYVSGIGIGIYTVRCFPQLRPWNERLQWDWRVLRELAGFSILTCIQQSIMNFGILMVQGLVNSFGPTVMAGFAAAVKIDSFAYMPAQDFGNAFSTFVAQNYGAGKQERIRQGIRSAVYVVLGFCLAAGAVVWIFSEALVGLFVQPGETEILSVGAGYLRVVGACYCGIGILFLLYGLYRAIKRPGMSVVLTILSLGTRVALAYVLSATALGVTGIWIAVPVGWALADAVGIGYYLKRGREE